MIKQLGAALAGGALLAACAPNGRLDRYQAVLLRADFEMGAGPATPQSGLRARIPGLEPPGPPAGDALKRVHIAPDDDSNLYVTAFFPETRSAPEQSRNALLFAHPGEPADAVADALGPGAPRVLDYVHADFVAAPEALKANSRVAINIKAFLAHDGAFDFAVYTGAHCEIATLGFAGGDATVSQGDLRSTPVVSGVDQSAGPVDILMRLDRKRRTVFVAIVNAGGVEGARLFEMDKDAGCAEAWRRPWTSLGLLAGFVGAPVEGWVMLDEVLILQ